MSTYEISKSSLLSLKAEILRKQDEVNKAKLQNRARAEREPKKSTPLELKNRGVADRARLDASSDDEDLLKKSRSALEAKSALYERLARGERPKGGGRYLVQFGRKLTYAKPPDGSDEDDYDRYPESDDERRFSDEYEPARNSGDEWIEYVDCLGRTRKCLRRDLEHIKQKDTELKSTIRKQEGCEEKDDDKISAAERTAETEAAGVEFDENSELLSNDMRTELLRQKWEKEEDELRKKSDIHYQDILFDEARVHGVGYYGFSKDEHERARQQEALGKLRQETRREQQKAEEQRKLRDAQLAARARAARNRKRTRMGLPPEEEGEATESAAAEEPESAAPERTAEDAEAERKREEQRKRHVRPWDVGKEGVKEEMSQEEWVRKKRRERVDEFAPPKRSERTESDRFGVDTSRPPPRINNPSKTHGLNPYKTREAKDYKTDGRTLKRRSIVNECSDSEDELVRDYQRGRTDEGDSRRKGVEIAPPPTFEYYGPSGGQKGKGSKSHDISDSITAGLQYLRQQAERKGRNRDDDMFIM